MSGRHIVYHNGFYSLPNEVACCNRLTGDSLKLLGLIVNRVNTDKAHFPSKVAMSRLLLKSLFGNKDDKTVKNYADRLKQYGFIDDFSKQGGDRGEFVFSVTDRPENNPFVLLSRIENEVIYLTELHAGQEADDLLEAFTAAVKAVEHDYVARLKNAAENEREVILTAYRDYLREFLQADGKAYVGTRQVKPKTNKAKSEPTETALPDDVQLWTLNVFKSYFLQEYKKVTGKKNHANKSKETGKTFEQCITDLEDHYKDYEQTERKPMMKKHIDAFFVNYSPPLFTPTAFLMANSGALCIVERYLETKVKHVPYEERSFKEEKKREKAPEAVPQMSMTEEQIDARNRAILKRIIGTAAS